MSGPLAALRVVELGGLGPAPFASMALADLGAEVLRIERIDTLPPDPERAAYDVLSRSRPMLAVDLKAEAGRDLLRALAAESDVLVEGFRPGVAERLGVGPEPLLADNPRLVYGRMTGWGQTGPLATRAGHDITYAAAAGALAHIGRRGQPPTPPLNLVADFGGGAMLLLSGILAALVERATSGRGQVVDAAMIDGVSMLMAPLHGAYALGAFSEERGTNLLDSGAPFYDCYECADGRFVAIGAIETQFFAELVEGLGLDPSWVDRQYDEDAWPALRTALAEAVATEPRDVWAERFVDTDGCVAPVLTLLESAQHPQLAARGTVVEVDGAPQPAPAPRFSRSAPASPTAGSAPRGPDADRLIASWGVSDVVIAAARSTGALG